VGLDEATEELGEGGAFACEAAHRAVPHRGAQDAVLVLAGGSLDDQGGSVLVGLVGADDIGVLQGPVGFGPLDLEDQRRVVRVPPQLVEGAAGGQAARADDRDAVAEPLDEFELVAGEEHGDAVCGFLPQYFAHGVDGQRVQSGEGFVQDQDVGFVD
jgi:hypothetical protein